MLYLKSLVKVLDNSGAQVVECIKVLRKSPSNCARVGDRMVVVVKKARPIPQNLTGQAAAQKLRKGDIRHAVVVRTKQPTSRPDGSTVRFDDNACVLIQKSGEIIGTRVTGVVAKELKEKGYTKIATLAPRSV
ncbi:54S ribosomal protein L38, mitochondrial [Wickerhamiella sorbophila]|uniref:Large ribosomal subunit protein uL14m n=1 Tax=Wickerhamiella sorbophila TaxID=45607 RepID=A0A2T0FMD3_9ASCO|nr:54S ribosomal protein L38, mitochondrial [Wickerhamiella sorbophila]PRT56135.1 54S ribosomal protein L38, mitochondrial [Wickerhamiella sorbophila]